MITLSFPFARENMLYDEILLQRRERAFRFYKWGMRGITYPSGRPSDIIPNSSPRITGGGIVFHCPGDVVFGCVAPLDDPLFPKKLKDKMGFISDLISKNLDLSPSQSQHISQDLNFCTTYHNPYELYSNGQKICGISLRKKRDFFIIQGIIHLQSQFVHFADLPKSYRPYFTAGLNGTIDAEAVIAALSADLSLHQLLATADPATALSPHNKNQRG